MLTRRWQVTAMDRRGCGSSGDGEPYQLSKEFDDVAAVLTSLARSGGRAAEAFADSYGATCLLGAATRGAQARRIVTYEP
jgi:predicted alpha/beta-fold hydrolase